MFCFIFQLLGGQDWTLDGAISATGAGSHPSPANTAVAVARSATASGFRWLVTFGGRAAGTGDLALLGANSALLSGSEAYARVTQVLLLFFSSSQLVGHLMLSLRLHQ